MTVESTRRGFLEAIGAFTAALAAGVKMPPAASGMPALPVQEAIEPLLEDCLKNAGCVGCWVSVDGRVTLRFYTGPGHTPTALNNDGGRLACNRRVVDLDVRHGRNGDGSTLIQVTVELA